MNPVLKRLLAQRQEQVDFISHLLEQVEAENRDLVDAERSNVDAARQRIEQLDAQITPLEEFEQTRSAHEETRSTVAPTGRRPAGGDGSGQASLGVQAREQKYPTRGHFIVDYLKARGQEVQGRVLPPDPDAAQRVAAATEGRALNTTADSTGLLPEPIIGEIHQDLDSSRPLISSVGVKPLTNVVGSKFHRPYVSQHTTSGAQSAEGGALPSQKLVIEPKEFSKTTRGGSLEISRQDLDWTQPAAWDAILADLQLTYGADSEDWTAGVFGTAVTQSVEVALADEESLTAWIKKLYEAAVMCVTANGTKRASALRLPDKIWTSVDMWGSLGSMLSAGKTLLQSSGRAKPNMFDGDLLEIERVMVPGLASGTMIVGRSNMFEYYEERIGLLQAVVPSTLKLEIAHGGYIAAGHLDATAFAKITVAAS